MANLPSQHPSLAIYLSDLTLTPLITSSSSASRVGSLSALASSAVATRTSAQRTHLGRPQRVMVEYSDRGPVVLHTFLDPSDILVSPAPAIDHHDPDANQPHDDGHLNKDQPQDPCPVLVGLVVAADADEAIEARRAAAKLERIARDFQRQWSDYQTAESRSNSK
ncbi:hypothetical protein GQ602_000736 [Ophiocordyceps camponoti-floridani]|uniref:Uncharacterized protein n=1 Tax=Ophiocordyceps camponoti-floridani TaxID=2030778 RepID=A0A8H4VGK7_9HYPO|nr:hypothetical protein GQ602_000736 [Ophiocordyceps camponoti-floridani]